MKTNFESSFWAVRVYDKKLEEEVYVCYGLSASEAFQELNEIKSLYFTGPNERFKVELANCLRYEVQYE